MFKKQKILIIVLAVVFALLVVSYFVIIRPIVNAEEPEETSEPVETDAPGRGGWLQ